MDFDVIIVGYGPVGATAANLLGHSNLKVAVLDAAAEIFNKPRAIVADHEMLRTLQMCGLPDPLSDYFCPYPGSNYIGVDGAIIKRFYALPEPYPLGWPSSATFIQPEFEGLLRRGVERHSNVEVFLGHELIELQYDEARANLKVKDIETGAFKTFTSRYLLACDGSRSFVRRTLKGTFEDLGFDEEWLVVDAWLTRPTNLPDISIQYCWPSRPATFVLGPRNLRRWELKLLPGEGPTDFESDGAIRGHLRPFVDVSAIEIWRSAVYRFHALVVDRWSDHTVFLVGDAAHQTPPFSGQGLCSGIRDAANIVWKIRHVEEVGADRILLGTYESERKPHFRTVVERSKKSGGSSANLMSKRPASATPKCALILSREPQRSIVRGIYLISRRVSCTRVLTGYRKSRQDPSSFNHALKVTTRTRGFLRTS